MFSITNFLFRLIGTKVWDIEAALTLSTPWKVDQDLFSIFKRVTTLSLKFELNIFKYEIILTFLRSSTIFENPPCKGLELI